MQPDMTASANIENVDEFLKKKKVSLRFFNQTEPTFEMAYLRTGQTIAMQT